MIHLPAEALWSRHQPLVLREVVLHELVTPGACSEIARAVEGCRARWTPAFEASQFTVGRAYYTHLEEGTLDQYFSGAAASRALVDEIAPGLAARMLGALERLVGGPLLLRSGWCGPGLHVFPAGSYVAEHGGEVHADTEGLLDGQEGAEALTLVMTVQRPEHGGGLRLWTGPHAEAAEEPATLRLAEGDAVVFESHRLHQIEPWEGAFAGARDRITATVHAVRGGNGWEAWF